MSTVDRQLKDLMEQEKGYWGRRILAQLAYARRLEKVSDDSFEELISETIENLKSGIPREGSITRSMALEAEDKISVLKPRAKEFSMICAGHAHIDMNWQWRYDETVAITLDTFRTVLDLLQEYPGFHFSQSQASVYRIVEKHAPSLLDEIQERIAEGRWEVTASTWVEADKNMPNGESMARHLLYTKRYLSELLGLEPASLDLDFEPDTFGHSRNVPEILSRAGVKYYYHCRGYDGHNLYRWSSPSGSSIVVYREPIWYNAALEPEMAQYVPEFCTRHNMDTMLKVYGVGDHGGGPTRRDLERMQDMNEWPVFPEIRGGTFGEYFQKADTIKDSLPVVNDELNFIFTGCYTTQTRIKRANRIGEKTLQEAELFNSFASQVAETEYPLSDFQSAWENILFNQFHDILPGSCTVGAREHALGIFQETMATANTRRKLSLTDITAEIDTSDLGAEETILHESTAEGAGVGFKVDRFQISHTERGQGKNRLYTVFNPSSFRRCELVELVVWDWPGDTDLLLVRDETGNPVDHQLIDRNTGSYWGHSYLRVLIQADIPSCGYRTYRLSERDEHTLCSPERHGPRVDRVEEYILENELIRAAFDPRTGALVECIDKNTGENLVCAKRPAGVFRLIEEDDSRGMTSWRVGRYMKIDVLNETENVKLTKMGSRDTLRQALKLAIDFRDSTLKAVISLDSGSRFLNYSVECDWQERGQPGKFVPQLNFYLPLNYSCTDYKYDIPFGTIERVERPQDVPANSWALGLREGAQASSLLLASDSKYGFRGHENALGLTLIRGAYDPDPYPELGEHSFSFAITPVDSGLENRDLIGITHQYNHPLIPISTHPSDGKLPPALSFMKLEKGSVAFSALKQSEDNEDAYVIRLYETEGTTTEVTLEFFCTLASARFVDVNEKPCHTEREIAVRERSLTFTTSPFQVVNLEVQFD